MVNFQEIKGDLIDLSYKGDFDVVIQGNNCFCTQKSGVAIHFVKHFRTNDFEMEKEKHKGDINKLGTIDYELLRFSNWDKSFQKFPDDGDKVLHNLYVVNCYTQYYYGSKYGVPLDYEALTLCLRKINKVFSGKRIGIPGLIGCGLGGGDSKRVTEIIKKELKDCYVTVVYLK